MKKIFLVDTENVNIRALHGARLLSSSDKIILFTTKRTSSTNFKDSIIQSLGTSAKIEKIDVTTGIKNSLDFQLVGYLGYLIGSKDENSNYYIVSKDKGYLSSINLLKNLSKNKCHIELISDILTISHNLYNVYSDPIPNLEEDIID